MLAISVMSLLNSSRRFCLFVPTFCTHLFWSRTFDGNVHRCCGRLPASSLSESLYGSSPQPKNVSQEREFTDRKEMIVKYRMKPWNMAVKRVICMGLLCER